MQNNRRCQGKQPVRAWPKMKRLMRWFCTNSIRIVDKEPELSMSIRRNFITWTHKTSYTKLKDSRLQGILGGFRVAIQDKVTLLTVWTLPEVFNLAIKIEMQLAHPSPQTPSPCAAHQSYRPTTQQPTDVVSQQTIKEQWEWPSAEDLYCINHTGWKR